MPDTTQSRSRALLTASEARLVAASRGAALTAATPAELRRKIARARALRDKWRTVHEQQRRGTQQARRARGTSGDGRSLEKQELFGRVLERFEARLDKLTDGGARFAKPKPGRPAKEARGRGHRRTRAQAKRGLAAAVAERASAGTRAAQKARPAASRPTRAAQGGSTRSSRKAAGSGKAAGAAGARKGPAGTRGASRTRSGKTTSTRGQSHSAATRQRLAASGRTTRVRAHVRASGRRAQVRRDRRG